MQPLRAARSVRHSHGARGRARHRQRDDPTPLTDEAFGLPCPPACHQCTPRCRITVQTLKSTQTPERPSTGACYLAAALWASRLPFGTSLSPAARRGRQETMLSLSGPLRDGSGCACVPAHRLRSHPWPVVSWGKPLGSRHARESSGDAEVGRPLHPIGRTVPLVEDPGGVAWARVRHRGGPL